MQFYFEKHWEDQIFTMKNLLKTTREFFLLLNLGILSSLVCLKKGDQKTCISSLTGEK